MSPVIYQMQNAKHLLDSYNNMLSSLITEGLEIEVHFKDNLESILGKKLKCILIKRRHLNSCNSAACSAVLVRNKHSLGSLVSKEPFFCGLAETTHID